MVSCPLLSVPHTDKQAVAPADCAGVMRCLLYSRVIYSFEGKKINKQTESTLPFVLEEIDRLPSFYHLPLVSPCPEFQGESSLGRKEAVSVVHTHTHTHTHTQTHTHTHVHCERGEEKLGRGREEKGPP